jgi:hypothetical protein
MKFLVGAVREPPLRVDFHGKACGYKILLFEGNSVCIAARVRPPGEPGCSLLSYIITVQDVCHPEDRDLENKFLMVNQLVVQ